mgnify:CR=1 FL=1
MFPMMFFMNNLLPILYLNISLKGIKLDKCDKDYDKPHYDNCEEKNCDNEKEDGKKCPIYLHIS